MVLSQRASLFLLAVGVWTWAIWPNFLRNIWGDERSWDGGPQPFFLVHLVLVVVSLVIGTAVGVLGVRGLRAARRRAR
ncbi:MULTISPECIES: SCO4848 family membrane protein [Kineococcus]|uniref:SCO4848 family membrane protein n=1 Tax=Kineococcus TaxID=33981 RepID=UPI0034DAD0A3